MSYVLYILPALLFFQYAVAQSFRWPLDPPHIITGNYGELRPNHFHAGIDLSTRNRENLPVYAVEEGYVSRIKISAYGYGKCVYITHPGNKVSVYAHLNSFSGQVARLVRTEQYSRKSFEVEIFPAPGTIQVKKGDVLAFSGNTGGSTGPHLHFELRDEKTEIPLNVLKQYRFADRQAPVLQAIGIYDLSDTCSPRLISTHKADPAGDTFRIASPLILNRSILGIAYSGFDRTGSSPNQNNIYSADLYFDGKLVHSHRLEGIPFSENRYVNEFGEKVTRYTFQKCFLPSLYPQELYGPGLRKGRIVLGDTLPHTLRLVLEDEAGNRTSATFAVRTRSLTGFVTQNFSGDFVFCTRDHKIHSGGIALAIQKGTLYNSSRISVENNLHSGGGILVEPALNLRNPAYLSFVVPPEIRHSKSKLMLKSGSAVYLGEIRNDSVVFAIKNFGAFQLIVDDTPPVVRVPQTKKGQQNRQVVFIIQDKESGIGTYSVSANGSWMLAEYDAKSNTLVPVFEGLELKGRVELKVEVSDRLGNKTVFSQTILR